MLRLMTRTVLILLTFVACVVNQFAVCMAQSQNAGCPVLATLATSKKAWSEGPEHIVIWFFNHGRKSTRGIQFELFMLDAVGNRYPAAQKYISTGEIKPQSGDVVEYPTDAERQHFGDSWALIEGVEVRVTRLMFTDDTVWLPAKGYVCKMVFMNDEYDAELARWRKSAEKKVGQQNSQK
jgi:hypothetical protein